MTEEPQAQIVEDLDFKYESILSGKLPGSELVIGMVGAVGADLDRVVRYIADIVKEFDYTVNLIKMSRLIAELKKIDVDNLKEPSRTNELMTAGDELRIVNNAILSLAAVHNINSNRPLENEKPSTKPRHIFVINSLKHPEEVNALRRIYGNGFFLLGVYVDEEKRKQSLINKKDISPSEADALINRDTTEGIPHGQRMRDTFHLSDVFVELDDEIEQGHSKAHTALERAFDVLFSDPYATPLFDEYAMFMAFAAATRSADLSRQIGAVIARDDAVLAAGANECPRYGGGTYWPFLDDSGRIQDCPDGRDSKRGKDSNDEEKSLIIQNAVDAIKDGWEKAKKILEEDELDILQAALANSMIDDITEYGRVVHAEMEALLTCSRSNIDCKGATLYTTTFPCHNCAKHIIAAGIERVVYIEPYPKSRAFKFHDDSIFDGFLKDPDRRERVAFEPFVGIGPRRFFDLFSMRHGSGFPLKRKDESGCTLPWERQTGTIRLPLSPLTYLEREAVALLKFGELRGGLNCGNDQVRDSGDSNGPAANAKGD